MAQQGYTYVEPTRRRPTPQSGYSPSNPSSPTNWVDTPTARSGVDNQTRIENNPYPFDPTTRSPSSPFQGGNPSAPSEDWSQGGWDADRVRRYFASRGVTPNDSSPQYWVDRWNEWGQRDPAYFLQRLAAADEIIGGPQNSPFRGSGGAGGGGGASPVSGFTQQIRNLLMARLQQAGQPVSADDPTIAGAVNAARLDGARATEASNRMLAERLWAGGEGRVDSNQAQQGAQQSAERMAVSTGNLRAQLITRELESRRNELQNYLGLALQSGEAETAREIQMALAQLEAQLRREGYGVTLAGMQTNQNNAPFGYF